MATIAVNYPYNTKRYLRTSPNPIADIQHVSPKTSAVSLFSRNRDTRDTEDMLMAVLKAVRYNSKVSHIRHHSNVGNYKPTIRYLAILTQHDLIIEECITHKNSWRNKKTGKRHIRIIKRYYVTPKGYLVLKIYDAIQNLFNVSS
jgi:hypothetical protein